MQARRYFKLHKPIKDREQSTWDALEQIYQQTGIRKPDLDNPPVIPPAVTHVWAWFFELNRARQSGMGLNPLSWGEIDAYCRLTGQRMQRWELNLLAIFDTAFLDVMQKEESEVKEGLDNAETDV